MYVKVGSMEYVNFIRPDDFKENSVCNFDEIGGSCCGNCGYCCSFEVTNIYDMAGVLHQFNSVEWDDEDECFIIAD